MVVVNVSMLICGCNLKNVHRSLLDTLCFVVFLKYFVNFSDAVLFCFVFTLYVTVCYSYLFLSICRYPWVCVCFSVCVSVVLVCYPYEAVCFYSHDLFYTNKYVLSICYWCGNSAWNVIDSSRSVLTVWPSRDTPPVRSRPIYRADWE